MPILKKKRSLIPYHYLRNRVNEKFGHCSSIFVQNSLHFSVLFHNRNLVWLFNNTDYKARVSIFTINGIVVFRER